MRASVTSTLLLLSLGTLHAQSGDGVPQIYALILGESGTKNWDVSEEFYRFLKGTYRIPESNISFLVEGAAPSGYENIVKGADKDFTTPEEFGLYLVYQRGLFLAEIDRLATMIDGDDLFICFVNSHGLGYDGNGIWNNSRVRPEVTSPDDGDYNDYTEQQLTWTVFSGSGLVHGSPNVGLGQWGVHSEFRDALFRNKVQQKAKCFRFRFLSHYPDMTLSSGLAPADSDTDIEQVIDYAVGDLDNDGYIDEFAGETFDADNDGRPAYNPGDGTMDEDEWGDPDIVRDNYNVPTLMCPLSPATMKIFDANLDNRLDIDLEPGATLVADMTDVDNDGVVEGMDVNGDGDMADNVAVDEFIIACGEYEVRDDDIAAHLRKVPSGVTLFATSACYSGGLVDDLSGPQTIVVTGAGENGPGAEGGLEYFLKPFTIGYDPNIDGLTTIDEAFNYFLDPPGVSSFGLPFQYDDNGDRVSTGSAVPSGGDGALGSRVSLNDWPAVARPLVIYNEGFTYNPLDGCIYDPSQYGYNDSRFWYVPRGEYGAAPYPFASSCLQTSTPGGWDNLAKVTSPSFAQPLYRTSGDVILSWKVRFPTDYGSSWRENNKLYVALCDNAGRKQYILRFKPNRLQDCYTSPDLELCKMVGGVETVIASASSHKVTPHGASAAWVRFELKLNKNGSISVSYDPGSGVLARYIMINDATFSEIARFNLTYKTGVAPANYYIQVDDLKAAYR